MTPRRRRFEAYHKTAGYFVYFFATGAVASGLMQYPMPGLAGTILAIVLIAFVLWSCSSSKVSVTTAIARRMATASNIPSTKSANFCNAAPRGRLTAAFLLRCVKNSAFGTKRTCLVALHMSAIGDKADMPAAALHMSAIGDKADMAFCIANVCFRPKADIPHRSPCVGLRENQEHDCRHAEDGGKRRATHVGIALGRGGAVLTTCGRSRYLNNASLTSCGWDRSWRRASTVGKKVPPSELLAHSVTHQHRGFRVRQHLVCHAAQHDCG